MRGGRSMGRDPRGPIEPESWQDLQCAATAPASAPTKACEELDRIPRHQVMRFQAPAPIQERPRILAIPGLCDGPADSSARDSASGYATGTSWAPESRSTRGRVKTHPGPDLSGVQRAACEGALTPLPPSFGGKRG